jgi:hypothetical protein
VVMTMSDSKVPLRDCSGKPVLRWSDQGHMTNSSG